MPKKPSARFGGGVSLEEAKSLLGSREFFWVRYGRMKQVWTREELLGLLAESKIMLPRRPNRKRGVILLFDPGGQVGVFFLCLRVSCRAVP